MSYRAPVVAGRFYPANPQELRREIARFCEAPKAEKWVKTTRGCLVPHAGYVFSGRVAGTVYTRLPPPDLVILLGPNHTGLGRGAAVWPEGAWRTPLGEVPVDGDAARELIGRSEILEFDEDAHLHEHSLEVEIPFLQTLNPDVRIVPVCLAGLSLARCEQLGMDLADFVRRRPERVLILASSDMNHYESDEYTRKVDAEALSHVEALDPRGLYETVRSKGISMCGVVPTTTTLAAMQALGVKHAELTAYATSSEVNGDHSRVVGYAGALFY